MSIPEHARAHAPKPSPTVLRPRRLVGRDSEIRDVSESVTSATVTTLLGPGGVGKPALAITTKNERLTRESKLHGRPMPLLERETTK